MITANYTKVDNDTLRSVVKALAKAGEKRLAMKLYLLSRVCQRPGWEGLQVDEVRVSNTEAAQVTDSSNRGNAWKMLLSVADELGIKVAISTEEADSSLKTNGFTKAKEAPKCCKHPKEAPKEAPSILIPLGLTEAQEAPKEAPPKTGPSEEAPSILIPLVVASTKEAPRANAISTRLVQDCTPLPPTGGLLLPEKQSQRLRHVEDLDGYEPPEPFVQRPLRPSRRVEKAIRGGIKPTIPIMQLLQESNLEGAILFFDLMKVWPKRANQNAVEAAIVWLSCLAGGAKAEVILDHARGVVMESHGRVTQLRKFLEQQSWDMEPPAMHIPEVTESMLGAFR